MLFLLPLLRRELCLHPSRRQLFPNDHCCSCVLLSRVLVWLLLLHLLWRWVVVLVSIPTRWLWAHLLRRLLLALYNSGLLWGLLLNPSLLMWACRQMWVCCLSRLIRRASSSNDLIVGRLSCSSVIRHSALRLVLLRLLLVR